MTKEEINFAREKEIIDSVVKIITDPLIGLIIGVATTEQLYHAGFFGSDVYSSITSYSGFLGMKKTVTTTGAEAHKTKNNIETAIYVMTVARALAPTMPYLVQLGESALGAIGNIAKPALPAITGALSGA